MAYCSKCGTPLNEGAKFCPKCGNACGEKCSCTSKKGSVNKKPLVITASVAIVLALLCCCVFVWNNFGKDYSLEGLADIVADYDDINNFYDGMARVTKGGKVGFIDKKGNEVIPCVYDRIDIETQLNFSCGLVLVRKGDKLFFIQVSQVPNLPVLIDRFQRND